MRAAPPLAFPTGRALAGWWPRLAPLAPQSLSVGHLLLHHVEALVESERAATLDVLPALVLRALALAPALPLAELDRRLHLGRQYLARILGELAACGVAEVGAGGVWRATGAPLRRATYERRTFHFRDAPQPGFVPLRSPPCYPVPPPEGWRFDPGRLRDCVARPHQWKEQHGFPQDVRAVLTPEGAPDEPTAWRRVVVDRAEQLALALVAVPGELLGLVVEPRGWVLHGERPALRMGSGWPETFPELAKGPPPEAWRAAWRAWCLGHGVSAGAAEACTLRHEGIVLWVGGLREAPAEEVWLLAGDGMLRTAARVEWTA
jgi:hypothetical protein